jgi:hypothetical protein
MTLNEQDQRLHRRLDRLARIVAALKRVAACWYGWEVDAAPSRSNSDAPQS